MFEYECRVCKTRFEQLVFDRAASVTCSKCGSADVAQQLSTFAVRSESARPTADPSPCAGCQGMQGGTCPMNQ